MRHYSVAAFRTHIAHALDEVEQGETVIVERRGKRFRLVAEGAASWPSVPKRVAILDPAVLDGNWTWEYEAPGEPLQFAAREPAPRKRK